MILHFTSTMNSLLWCHSSSGLASFWALLPWTGIVSHYRESMISLPEDRCAHYEWSGALIIVIVRESWGWFGAGVAGRLHVSSHWGAQRNKNTRYMSMKSLLRTLDIQLSRCILRGVFVKLEMRRLVLFDVTPLVVEAAVCRSIVAPVVTVW